MANPVNDGVALTCIAHPNTPIPEGVHEFSYFGDQACIRCGALFPDIWRGNGRWTYKCEGKIDARSTTM